MLVHRRIFVVLAGDLGTTEMEIVIKHLGGGVPQDLLQAEDIAPVKQVVGSEGVAAKVSMQPFNAGDFGKSGEYELSCI